jgi:hypothetical protein
MKRQVKDFWGTQVVDIGDCLLIAKPEEGEECELQQL